MLSWAIVCGPLHNSNSQSRMLIRRTQELLNMVLPGLPFPQFRFDWSGRGPPVLVLVKNIPWMRMYSQCWQPSLWDSCCLCVWKLIQPSSQQSAEPSLAIWLLSQASPESLQINGLLLESVPWNPWDWDLETLHDFKYHETPHSPSFPPMLLTTLLPLLQPFAH